MTEKLPRFIAAPATEYLKKFLQLFFLCGFCLYLVRELSTIGWEELWENVPTAPAYYFILLTSFLLLPYSELLIYRPLWPNFRSKGLAVLVILLRKQALNDVIIGYSGEAFFVLWAKQNIGISMKAAFNVIKDNNLISAAVSALAALVIVLFFTLSDQLAVLTQHNHGALPFIIGAMSFGILLVPFLVLFGRRIITLSKRRILRIATLHSARIFVFESLLLIQWSIVIPDIPLGVWVGFIAARMVLTRIPLLPNKDLILLGLAVTLSEYLPDAGAAVGALFLTSSAITQLLNTMVLMVTGLREFFPERAKVC
ncbi:MAG: hypothetical protein EP335_09085 [Alphaproteobacteria bacterium]|nr:MAG: hypothetical protein EP335_09085 [Alphaproteobacteria bacterium]